jgi:multicomponent Na+:H+ antiporter subunit C
MNAVRVFGLCAAALVGLGLYGLIASPQPLRKILAFNLLGSGVFLMFGVVARRGAAAGLGGDPVPQALVITGIVVAFSATAMAVALLLRLFPTTGWTPTRTEMPTDAECARHDDGRRLSVGAVDRIAGHRHPAGAGPRRTPHQVDRSRPLPVRYHRRGGDPR